MADRIARLTHHAEMILTGVHATFTALFGHRLFDRNLTLFLAAHELDEPVTWARQSETTQRSELPETADVMGTLHDLANTVLGSPRNTMFATLASSSIIDLPRPWLGGLLPWPIPIDGSALGIVGWAMPASDLWIGRDANEWVWDHSDSRGVFYAVLRELSLRPTRETALNRALLTENDNDIGAGEAPVVAPMTSSAIDIAVEEAMIAHMHAPTDVRLRRRIQQGLRMLKRIATLTMERRNVTGGVLYATSDDAYNGLIERTKGFVAFDKPYDLATTGRRTIVKLVSITNGANSFLVVANNRAMGIVETYGPCRFSDSQDWLRMTANLHLGSMHEIYSDMPKSACVIFRVVGPGTGSIAIGRRRLIDLREGEFCFESAQMPFQIARYASLQAGCAWPVVMAIERALVELRARQKGAMFLLVGTDQFNLATLGNVMVPCASSRPISQVDTDVLADLAALDGAMVVDSEGRMCAAGVILAPPACDTENFDFGARHNSALRFTHVMPNATIVTLSEDGFISAFRDGHYTAPQSLQLAPTDAGQASTAHTRRLYSGVQLRDTGANAAVS